MNVLVFFLAIAKAALLTGVGPGIAIAVFLEIRGVRILELGIERVSARAVSQARYWESGLENPVGNKPARNFSEAA